VAKDPAYLCLKCSRAMCPACKEIALEYEEMPVIISTVKFSFEEERRELQRQVQYLNRRVENEKEMVELLTSSLPDLMRKCAQEQIAKERRQFERKVQRALRKLER